MWLTLPSPRRRSTNQCRYGEVLPRGKCVHERRNLCRVLRRPHWMGLGIVANINSARSQQGEHFVKQDMLADAAIGEHEIEGIWRLALHRPPSINRRPPRTRREAVLV